MNDTCVSCDYSLVCFIENHPSIISFVCTDCGVQFVLLNHDHGATDSYAEWVAPKECPLQMTGRMWRCDACMRKGEESVFDKMKEVGSG